MGFSVETSGNPVTLVGLGARTAIGLTARMSAASVRARVQRFHEHSFLVDLAGEPMITASMTFLPEAASSADRLIAMSLPALVEALKVVDWSISRSLRRAVLIGSAMERPGLGRESQAILQQHLEKELVAQWGPSQVEWVEGGHCAGLMAVEQGCLRIARGEADLCIVGGCDSYLAPETLEWLDMRDQLKSRSHRWGLIPGEAAGFCLLASPRTAARLGLTVLGRVLSAVTAREESPFGTPTVCTGMGLTRAISRALQPLPSDTQVDAVFCDQNGERYRADEYGFTLARLAHRFREPSGFHAPADCWGDIGAASGPLFLCLAAMAGQRGYAPGPRSLLWTSSEGGERSAVLLEVPPAPPRC